MNYLLRNICALCCVVALCAWQVSPAQNVKKCSGSVSSTERTIPVNSKWTSVLTSSLANQQVRHWLFQRIDNKHKTRHWCHCNLNLLHFFTGQKYECARKWNVYCVSLHWLFDSIEKGFCQDESRYTVACNTSKSTRLHTSTPTGTNKKEGELERQHACLSQFWFLLYSLLVYIFYSKEYVFLDGPSFLGLSHISINASIAVNDTALTNDTISRLEIPDPIDSLDLTICPADDILDGCKVSNGKFSIMKINLLI